MQRLQLLSIGDDEERVADFQLPIIQRIIDKGAFSTSDGDDDEAALLPNAGIGERQPGERGMFLNYGFGKSRSLVVLGDICEEIDELRVEEAGGEADAADLVWQDDFIGTGGDEFRGRITLNRLGGNAELRVYFSRGDDDEKIILVSAETGDEPAGSLDACAREHLVIGCIAVDVEELAGIGEMEEAFFLQVDADKGLFGLEHFVKHMDTCITDATKDIVV